MARTRYRKLFAVVGILWAVLPLSGQTSGTDVHLSWVFRTLIADDESPHSEVWLKVTDAKGTRQIRCGETLGGFQVLEPSADPNVLTAGQGWWAGGGDQFSVSQGPKGLNVTHTILEEESEPSVEAVVAIPLNKTQKVVVGAAQEIPFPVPGRELKLQRPRMEGDDVDYLQFLLALHGGAVGTIDGIFGPMTEAALKRFQTESGLRATGTTNEATWEALLRWR